LTFLINEISEKVILSNCMEYSLYPIWGRLQILGGQDPTWPPDLPVMITISLSKLAYLRTENNRNLSQC